MIAKTTRRTAQWFFNLPKVPEGQPQERANSVMEGATRRSAERIDEGDPDRLKLQKMNDEESFKEGDVRRHLAHRRVGRRCSTYSVDWSRS